MNKRDVRLWKYVKPMIKGDYDLIVRTNADKEIYEYELENSRVQSIKLNKKTGRLEIIVKCIFE